MSFPSHKGPEAIRFIPWWLPGGWGQGGGASVQCGQSFSLERRKNLKIDGTDVCPQCEHTSHHKLHT